MSRTYRLKKYENGKPIYTRHENKYPPYRWYRHEFSEVRRSIYRSYRMKQKQYFKRFGEFLPFNPTNGWETW